MKLKILKRHIQRGRRGHTFECPIALALLDHGFQNPTVSCVDAFGWKDGRFIGFTLDKKASRFVHLFDLKRKVAPCVLNLIA